MNKPIRKFPVASTNDYLTPEFRFPSLKDLSQVPFRPPTIVNPNQFSNTSTDSCSSSWSHSSAKTDDEYGYYDDSFIEEVVTPIEEQKNSSKSHSSSFRSLPVTPLASANASKNISRCSSSVLCQYEDEKATLTCRSFETVEMNSKCTVSVALAGIRIVQEGLFREIAEYKLRITLENQEFITWKRYEDFSSLGEACSLHMKNTKRNSSGSSGNNKNNKQLKGRKCSLQNTVNAWNDVLDHRPWFSSPTGAEFLLEELDLLENFMKNFLFEIPCVEMLVEFVT
jgi:hypothetical protein